MKPRAGDALATPRYVPAPRRAMPDDATAGRPDFEAPPQPPRRLAEDTPVSPDDAAARTSSRAPTRTYVLALTCFTVGSVALVAWLVFGLAGGRVVWQMLVPLVPWALLLVALWVQVAWRARSAAPGQPDTDADADALR